MIYLNMEESIKTKEIKSSDAQYCPVCGYLIGIIPGSADAICKNCGFKDPCCE